MSIQAEQWDPIRKQTVYRWILDTDAGRRVTWKADEAAARSAAEARGLSVNAVRASASGE